MPKEKKKDKEFAKKLKEEIIKKTKVSPKWAKDHLIVIKAQEVNYGQIF